MGPRESAIQAKIHPSVTTLGQLNLAFWLGRHFRGVINKQLLADLIADPQFLFIGCESRSVRAMGNMFLSCIDTVRNLSRFQIHHIKADVIPQAHIGDAVTAIHGVGKYPAFAYVLDLADHLFIVRIKYRQHRLAAKV